MICQHCRERIEWCSKSVCVRIAPHLVHSATGIGACRGNRTTALAFPDEDARTLPPRNDQRGVTGTPREGG